MENFHWSEYWDSIKASLLSTYAFLTDSDLYFEEGRENKVLLLLASKFGVTAAEVNTLLFYHLIYSDSNEKRNSSHYGNLKSITMH